MLNDRIEICICCHEVASIILSESNSPTGMVSMSSDNPYSPPTKPENASLVNPPELTLRVIILGLILSVVMGAANVYVGLKAGMTVFMSRPKK